MDGHRSRPTIGACSGMASRRRAGNRGACRHRGRTPPRRLAGKPNGAPTSLSATNLGAVTYRTEEGEMSRLGDEIRRTMGEREAKDLFAAYVEALDGAEHLELSTFTTKLSKLLNGNA